MPWYCGEMLQQICYLDIQKIERPSRRYVDMGAILHERMRQFDINNDMILLVRH